jgi:hypothetical protein
MIESWKQMMEVIGTMTEDELRSAINHEVATFCRKAIIKRLYQRYGKLNRARILTELCNKEVLL